MADFQEFYQFAEDMNNNVHDMASDTFTLAFTDISPVVTDSILTDITEIIYTGLGSRDLVLVSSTQTAGLYSFNQNDLTIAVSGTIPQFRYVVMYNNTAAGDPLIGWWDGGKEFNLISGESFIFNFDAGTTYTVQFEATP